MIDVGCLKTIQTQWEALAVAFKRLADALPIDDPRAAAVGNPQGEARGFEWQAINEAHTLGTRYAELKDCPPPQLQVQIPLVLKASQQVRGHLEMQFMQTGMFGSASLADNLDEVFCRKLLKDLESFIGDYLREYVTP